MTEENKFIDAESYQGGGNWDKNKLTFKDIVILHVKKIGEFASCEWRGGFWLSKPSPNINSNSTIDVYQEDTRERYSNGVEYLHDLLYPYFDKKMEEESKVAEDKLKELYEDNTVLVEPDREDQNIEEGKEYRRKFDSDRDKVSYRRERVKVCRRLFRELCCFLFRKKYLELGVIED